MLPLLALAVRPLLMVHIMPWFSLNPQGWHWTMGKMDAAKGELASHYRPLGGAYDSNDPDLVERQTLEMKIAGFDGMLVDWYGDRDRYDYLPNHKATEKLFEGAKRTGLSFALVYEDATVPNLISGGVFEKADAVSEGHALFGRVAKRWFGSKTYQRLDGKPLVMVFGPQYYGDDDWPRIFDGLAVTYLSLHRRKGIATGAYDWPLPQGGEWAAKLARFREESKTWPVAVPVAFPRFHDFYKQAGVGESYGEIPDAEGETYRKTLLEATTSGRKIVQVATWNDWGEGTQIEPSEKFGYRDLETTQARRRALDPAFPYKADDLRLPMRLYTLRKKGADRRKLDRAAKALANGKPGEARKLLG